MPGLVTYLVDSSNSTAHASGLVLDYVVPPGYTSHYSATIHAPIPPDAFNIRGRENRRGGVPPFMAQQAPEPDIDYNDESWTLLKNAGYAAIFFVLGCIILTRRELRLA